MATHGRTGEALQQYHDRKRRPHIVSGRYVSDGTSSKGSKVMSLTEYMRKLQLRGSRGVGKKGKGEASAKASQSVVHWRPLHCEGR